MRIKIFSEHTQHTLFKRFKKYNKWDDLVDFTSFECELALMFTVIFLTIIIVFRIYSNFKCFEIAFQNVTLYIASALIGMIGIILAGIAVIIGLLNKDAFNEIEKINGKNSVDKVLVSFEFLTFIIGTQIIIFFLTYIILYSPFNLPPQIIFYLIFAALFYIFTFTIFYTIGLVSNSIKIFFIKIMYNEISENEKNLYLEVNEIRIEFILNTLIEKYGIKKEDFLSELQTFVNESNINDKETVKKYLRQYYSGDI